MAFFIQSHRWLDGIVPYTVAGSGVTAADKKRILEAMYHWHGKTVIRFRPRTTEKDQVKIVVKHGLGKGDSAIGRRGGTQDLRFDPEYDPDDDLPWSLIHELAHAVGMIHEYQRPDRNLFVKIASGADSTYSIDHHGIMVGPYDCHSTMSPTSRPKLSYIPGACEPTGHGLSAGDSAGIEYVYAGALGSNVASYNWTSGWTNAFFYEVSGKPYMFFLKSKTGEVDIHRVNNNDGTVGSLVTEYDWSGGWTNAFFYKVSGKPYMFFLKSKTGEVDIHRVNNDGTVGPLVAEYDWSGGWTTAFFYEVSGKPYMFFLKSKTGDVDIHRVNNDGTVGPLVDEYDWKGGWTTAFFYRVSGKPFMFFLKEQTGAVDIHAVNADGTVGEKVHHQDWSSGWTNGLFYEVDGHPYMFFLKAAFDAKAARSQVFDDGNVGADLEVHNWTSGWTTAFVYRASGKPYIFLLKRKDGTARVRRIGVGP